MPKVIVVKLSAWLVTKPILADEKSKINLPFTLPIALLEKCFHLILLINFIRIFSFSASALGYYKYLSEIKENTFCLIYAFICFLILSFLWVNESNQPFNNTLLMLL